MVVVVVPGADVVVVLVVPMTVVLVVSAPVVVVVLSTVVLVVLAVVVVVPITVVVVVVGPGGQTHPGWHSSIAPVGDSGLGHVKLPGGSQSSPGSFMLLPQTGPSVVVVETDVVLVVLGPVVLLVVGTLVVVVATPHVMSPERHAASTLDKHCPRPGVPGVPQVASIWGRHEDAPHCGDSASSSPFAERAALAALHVPAEHASQQLA